MSFIAQRPVRPAERDVTDVDDGGAQIAIGTFWPTVKLHDLRLAARIAGDITTSRLMHMATEAALHVADQLKDWRKQREAEGAESLASVLLTSAGEPVEQINGESAKVYRFRRAVYSFTRASVLEGYRDVGTTPKGDKDAEALDRQIDDQRIISGDAIHLSVRELHAPAECWQKHIPGLCCCDSFHQCVFGMHIPYRYRDGHF
ncbi:head completion/stabilization protein [Klebsiella michiganensis]|uniref:head completion/stabilization protein n=1 Tax=Klebsiella michiganensis TaxID=1134687 RepID=UPI001CCE0B1C|nr:head completion/stabilization protein [Klebsiella michiganensis]